MNIIFGGDEAFNAVAFGAQHQANETFLASFYSTPVNEADQGFFGSFYQKAKANYDKYNNSEAKQIARAALNQVTGFFQPNTIRQLHSLAELQVAGTQMQRWIMADTFVRTLYHEQRIDGYSDSYRDMEPGRVGEDHYDYRLVNHGIVHEDADGNCVSVQYLQEMREGDRPLEADEQFNILSTQELARHFMKAAAKDCTSAWNTDM